MFERYERTRIITTSGAGGSHNMPRPCNFTFNLESGVRVTCDVGFLCANFSLLLSILKQRNYMYIFVKISTLYRCPVLTS